MRVQVDESMCTGHANCWRSAPEFFTIDELGHSDLTEPKEVPAGMEAKARLGVNACPERALFILD